MNGRRRTDGTGGAQRMAQRDGAAHGVDLGRVQTQGLHHRQRLRGKGFIELNPVDVGLLKACKAERRRNGLDGAYAHDVRRHAAAGIADKARQGLEAVRADGFFAGQDQRACAVRCLRGIACRDRTTRGKHCLEFGQAVHRGVGARAFVQADGTGAELGLTALQIGAAMADLHGCDFILELTGLLRFERPGVRSTGKFILRLTRDFPLLRHLFGGQAHAVGQADVLVLQIHGRRQRRRIARHRHHAHALGAGRDHDVGLTDAYAVRRHLYR